MTDGLLVVDKPVGPTSHDVVARMRRVLGERRIGHTGTLDPAASGVLMLVVGRATRLARFMATDTKTYEAVVRLGASTDTYDAQGQVTGPTYTGSMPSSQQVEQALAAFVGPGVQRPPAYSAKKMGGRRSYDVARRRARAGQAPVAPAPVAVSVDRLELTSCAGGDVGLVITCSAGFYVRSLAHDLGERLGTGAHLVALRRTRVGDLTLADARALGDIDRDREAALAALVPMARLLPSMPSMILTPGGIARIARGQDVGRGEAARATGPGQAAGRSVPPGGWVRLLAPNGDLVAVAVVEASGLLHPAVVLK